MPYTIRNHASVKESSEHVLASGVYCHGKKNQQKITHRPVLTLIFFSEEIRQEVRKIL